uniref:Uncharacterized protein n=3 Tax=Caenorhabditis japonica TaxID=281687 RepID=A0A8R1I9H4_CAEJA
MQEVWEDVIDWNTKIPEALLPQWNSIKDGWTLKEVEFPRQITNRHDYKSVQLLMFSDASKDFYACVAYLHFEIENGPPVTNLLTCPVLQAFTNCEETDYVNRRRIVRWFIILEHYRESESQGFFFPKNLTPFEDKHGLNRTHRSIESAGTLSKESTNPILIHRKHPLARLIV